VTQSQLQFVYELSLWFKEHAISGKAIKLDIASWSNASATLKQIMDESPMSDGIRRKRVLLKDAAEAAAKDGKPPKLRAIEL